MFGNVSMVCARTLTQKIEGNDFTVAVVAVSIVTQGST